MIKKNNKHILLFNDPNPLTILEKKFEIRVVILIPSESIIE